MLKRLVRCSTLPEALAVESVLKGYGVAHIWVGREFASQRWDLIIALGGVDVMVPSDDYEMARKILESGEPLVDADRCWQSRLFWQAPISNGLFALALLIVFHVIWPIWIAQPYGRRSGEISIEREG